MAEVLHRSGAPLWGVAAEFDSAEAVLHALHTLRGRGLGRLDAYSPVPVPGAAEALDLPDKPVHPFAIGATAIGALATFAMCTYATIWGYRFNIGGRPNFSWPAFIVPSVSFGALFGAIVVYALMLAMSRLPRLNHPAFNIGNFTRVTADGFFVAVEAQDDRFDPAVAEAALRALRPAPLLVTRVPR